MANLASALTSEWNRISSASNGGAHIPWQQTVQGADSEGRPLAEPERSLSAGKNGGTDDPERHWILARHRHLRNGADACLRRSQGLCAAGDLALALPESALDRGPMSEGPRPLLMAMASTWMPLIWSSPSPTDHSATYGS